MKKYFSIPESQLIDLMKKLETLDGAKSSAEACARATGETMIIFEQVGQVEVGLHWSMKKNIRKTSPKKEDSE